MTTDRAKDRRTITIARPVSGVTGLVIAPHPDPVPLVPVRRVAPAICVAVGPAEAAVATHHGLFRRAHLLSAIVGRRIVAFRTRDAGIHGSGQDDDDCGPQNRSN